MKTTWTKDALTLLSQFIKGKKQFMCEDFRGYCELHDLDMPKSGRAFGILMRVAKGQGLIRQAGFKAVNNPIAHRANAAVWEVV